MTSLSTGTSYTFHLTSTSATSPTRRSPRHGISKRDTSCWGDELDHGGVDERVERAKALGRPSMDRITSPGIVAAITASIGRG
ncbi:hypothetical protein VE04_06655, partial [Pseudogymnoascus sp. 24MN13]